MRFLFLGAGSAATGIGDLLTHAMTREGLSEREARQRSWFVDSEGLLVKSRAKMAPHKMPYAHDHAAVDFPTAIDSIRPHVLIGATGRPGTFTEAIVRQMTAVNERPVIFALSNPTSRAECTAEQAYAWSDGRVVFASGSPFPAIERPDGTPWRPGQGNNAYVFPGIGLGAIGCEAKTLSDDVFLVAARALASQTAQADLDAGSIYPRMSRIRDVSIHIAAAVAAQVADEGLARVGPQDDWASHFQRLVYDPAY